MENLNLSAIKRWIETLRRQTLTVWFVARDSRMTWSVKMLALGVAAYAFSPIDLIPDFIPVLGLLDDLLLIPLGLALVIRLTPEPILEAARSRAEQAIDRPISRLAGVVIVVLWVLCAALLAVWLLRR